MDSYSSRWSRSDFYDFYFGSDDDDDDDNDDADDDEATSHSIKAVVINCDDDDAEADVCSDSSKTHLLHGERLDENFCPVLATFFFFIQPVA